MLDKSKKHSSRRKEILDAALTCFTEHGYANTKIDMIRKHSGASVGSMYHHFRNKEEIASELYILGVNDHNERLIDVLQKASSAEGGVRSAVLCLVSWIEEHPDWARFILHTNAQVVKGESTKQLEEINKAFRKSIRSWFHPHIESGEITSLPPELYPPLIVGPSMSYARHWLSGKSKTRITKYGEHLATAAWKAVKRSS